MNRVTTRSARSNPTGSVRRLSLVVLVAFALCSSGCGRLDRWWASTTGTAAKVCVDGVEYLQFTSGASVAYTRDGKIKTC